MADVERYAIVRSGKVENVTLWDGDTGKWSPPAGATAVKDATGKAEIGGTYSGGKFSPPAVKEPPPPDPDVAVLEAAKTDVTVPEWGKALARKVVPDVVKPVLARRSRAKKAKRG